MATATKTSNKTAKGKKTVKKTVKAKVSRPARDNARLVAKASEGALSTDQVRQLRSLAKGKTLTRDDIKEAVGIGREGKYSSKWLTDLWELNNKGLLLITEPQEGERAQGHTITAKGKQALERAEKAAKSL